MTYPGLAGRTAVVTGGSKGIGEATCRLLAANGAKVAVVARGREAVDALASDLRAGGADALGVAADCTSAVSLERVREQVERQLGPVDVLAAFAGGFTHAVATAELAEDEWRSLIDSNLTSTFLTVKTFLPGMVERRRGALVLMSSSVARAVDRTVNAAYAAAKGGIAILARHVATEVGPYGVRVNCVAPATVLTPRVEAILDDERRAAIAAMAPLGTMGSAEDVAHATLYLCSDAAAWITGVTIDVAGGRIML